jgi:hypothetical protein
MNTDYVDNTISAQPVKPYEGYKVSTIMLTAGIDIPFSPRE